MNKNLFGYLKTIPDFSYPDTESDFDEFHAEKEFGCKFPDDYKDVMKNCYCCEFYTDHNNINIWSSNDLYSINTDPLWMVPLRGLILFGGDNGGNFYAFDPKNKLGRGEFAVYYIGRTSLRFNEAKFIGKDLTSAVDRILKEENDAWDWPDMKQEGFPQTENKATPKAMINSMEELLRAIPSEVKSEKHGDGILEIKEENGRVSGSYYIAKTDMCLFYTFSRSYQGFYDAIAPALAMDGLL
ncbi:MAG: cell-wall [Bacteroidetes bacterium]|jgi:hypothetical protein|nr:cell-wall [Bacteroidota bacterium]